MTVSLEPFLENPAVQHALSWEESELASDFLGFLDNYEGIADRLPKMCKSRFMGQPDIRYMVIDFGCYQAVQSLMFPDQLYLGVDTTPLEWRVYPRYGGHVRMTVQEYLQAHKVLPEVTFAICSAVPDDEAVDLVRRAFPYHHIAYPGEKDDSVFPTIS